MPLATGVQRAPRKTDESRRLARPARSAATVLVATLFSLAVQLAPMTGAVPRAHADTPPPPKAVFIVGPAGTSMTDSNLVDAEKMAKQAEAVGMDVRRVFFPNATWDNVLANIQGANLVVYMGHGYGWPSPYTKVLTESRQDGMGLNTVAGSGANEYTYYGANLIRENILLASNAVVILVHGCYTAGNGEPGSAIPSEDLARERADNFASGYLGAGARAVFAFGWNQKLDYPKALATSDSTMDEMFMTTGGGSPAGWIGWHDDRFDSERTPGAMNHLDPHPHIGYYRAVTGDLNMTAGEWRSGTAPSDPPPPPPPGEAPQITSLSAEDGSTVPFSVAGSGVPSFHPNGDGLDEELVVNHTVTKAAYLDVTVTNSAAETVRTYTIWSASGDGSSRWNGKDNAGHLVPDGTYTLTYVPRDTAGDVGDPVATDAAVLTAVALAKPSHVALYASDGDRLARAITFKVTLNQDALVTWSLLDSAGNAVRTVRAGESLPAGLQTFVWDGRTNAGDWAPDGWYTSVVGAQTAEGAYAQARQVFVGAFQATPSISSPSRDGKITLKIVSTEKLGHNPGVLITQPGVEPWTVQAKHLSGRRYEVTVTLNSGGDPGTVEFLMSGVDASGGHQSSSLSLVLR